MDNVQDVQQSEQDIYHLLTKLFLQFDDSDRQFFNEYGLNTRQFWALYHLDEQSGLSMVDLSKVLLTDKSNVTAIVDRLEAAHYVRRTTAAHDRRVFLLTLTPEGRKVRDYILQRHNSHIHNMFSSLPQKELKRFFVMLQTISGNLDEYLSSEHSVHVSTD